MIEGCGDELDKAGPRVYVPIALRDSNVQTYAVLEFLGFSSSSSSSPYSLAATDWSSSALPSAFVPSPLSSPSSLLPLTVTSASSLVPGHSAGLSVANSSQACPNFSLTHHIGADTLPKFPQELHLIWPGAFRESYQGDTPPSSPVGIIRKGFYESGIRENKDRKLIPIKASTMKKTGSGGNTMASAAVGSPGGKKTLANLGVAAGISVSQTERETIVHTNSSNFREVVHQLTGASSNDQVLLPVTFPARYANRSDIGSKQDTIIKADNGVGIRIGELGPRKPTAKLHERRKAMKNLEKLSTTCKELPLLVPSPVTPLASDFEKICLPTTPPTKQGKSPHSLTELGTKPIMEDHRATNEPPNTAELLAIAEKGFYLHSERPRNSGPTLLNLFPESPACSPRGI
eukprot:c22188_g1_i1 orf=706-1914(+)